MKLIGYYSKDGIAVLYDYLYLGVLFQEKRAPGAGLMSVESLDDITDFDYAILHKDNKSSVVLVPPKCVPEGWTWYQLLNVVTATKLLPCLHPNEIKEIHL